MNIKLCLLVLLCSSLNFGSSIQFILERILIHARKLGGTYIQDRSRAIPVIAITGCSAVGKSYFTGLMAKALRKSGFNVFVLHQDDYLNNNRIFAGFKIHPNLDHDSLHQFLFQNSVGLKKITKPCIIDEKYIKNKLIDLTRVDLILFEGIYALTGPETYNLNQYCSIGIFLDASTDHIIKWHALRNKKRPFFKRFGDSDIKQHATCLLHEYVRFILPSKKNAQFIVYKDDLNSYRLMP